MLNPPFFLGGQNPYFSWFWVVGSWKTFPFLTKELNPEFLEQSQRYLMQVARHGMPSESGAQSEVRKIKDGVTWTYLLSIVFNL